MSKKISKKAVVTVLSVVTLGATCMAVAACNGNEPIGYIDAPETLEAELGTYTVPEYDVVDKNGMVLYGYNVRLKSVTGANGATVEITNRAVTVETAGIYDFVYTANSSGVADVTVKIDFADRTPPTINYDENNLPDFFITGNSYRMPAYTISGEFDREKCYAKVYHIATDKTETEVAVESNRFKVEATSGSYAIRIHVEDAVGNAKEYEYVRSVDGPEHYVENKVLYFDEEFGERQVAVYESEKYTGGFVSKDTEGAHVREGENGAYKVSFDGVTETSNNEGYVIMKVPAVVDITDHIELEMYVYNDSDADIKMGSPWWNDTDVKKGEWTRLTWKVDAAGWSDNRQIGSSKVISPVDITGTTIRFIFDYDQQIIPNGDFYLSSMRAVPKQRSAITAGDNVTLDRPDGAYFVGDTVELSAADVSGKTFDCFFVDGKPIIGNNFVARNDAHSVTAKYVDGALTKDNMTWGVVEEYETVGTDAKAFKLGEGDKWALTYDLYGISGTGWNYFGAYVGGADQLIGIELAGTDKHIALGYGGNWKGMTQIELSDEVTALLRGATDNAPVTAIYVRDGDTIKMLLKSAEKTYFVASWDFNVFEVSGNGFGIGERIGRDGDGNELVNATLKNIKGVAGAERVAAFMQEFKTEITKTNVTTEKDDYYIGDTVTLTAAAAPDGQIFSHFTVDGVRINGNTFTVTKLSYTVVAEYSEISDIEIAGNSGISTADGKTQYARGAFVKLVFDESKAPSGQVFDCFLVDGVKVNGDTFETSKAKHVITAKFTSSASDMTWIDVSEYETVGTDAKACKLGEGDKWVLTYDLYGIGGTGWNFFGAYVGGENQLVGIELAGSTYKAIGYYAGVDKPFMLSAEVGALLRGATEDAPVTAVYIRDGATIKMLLKTAEKTYVVATWDFETFGVTGNNFGIGERQGPTNATLKNIEFISSASKLGLYKETIKATIDTTNVTIEDKQYYIGDTVTLTAAPAPTGEMFSHFTVDGVRISGDTFTVTKLSYAVAAEYAAASELTLADGILTDGGIEVGEGKKHHVRGSKVKLAFDASKLGGKVVDYFVIDADTANEQRVYNGAFTATAATHSVTAVLVTPENMTWADGEVDGDGDGVADYDYVSVMGAAASEWKSRGFAGKVFGSAEYWAVSVHVKFASDWKSFEFIQGSKQSIRVRFHSGGYCGVILSAGREDEQTPTADFTVAYPTENAQVVNRLKNGATVTCVRNGGNISMYIDGYKFFSTDYAVDHTGDWFGVGHVDGKDATAPDALDTTKYITGKDKVEAYLAALAASDKAQKSEVQINSIAEVKISDSDSYVKTNIPEGLSDETVKENGVLKITAASDDVAFTASWTFDRTTANYSELYYYVYIESDMELINVGAGAHWQDKTEISANTWVRVSIDSTMIAKLDGGANEDLSKIIIRIYSKTWLEYTSISGKTIYVSSLYGVPKTA